MNTKDSKNFPNNFWRRKLGAPTLLLLVVSLFLFSAPRPAAASIPVIDIPHIAKTVAQSIWEALKFAAEKAERAYDKISKETAGAMFRKGTEFFVNKIAQDTALWIASGAKGQGPLFITQGWGEYMKDAADGAAGVMLDELTRATTYEQRPGSCNCTDINGSSFSKNATNETECTGLESSPDVQCTWTPPQKAVKEQGGILEGWGICAPDMDVQLRINLGLSPTPIGRPKCRFSKLKSNWEREISKASFLPDFQRSFSPEESDLGVALNLQTSLLAQQEQKRLEAGLERLEGGGFKPVTDYISGWIKVPGQTVKDTLKTSQETGQKSLLEDTGTILGNALGIFTNTLAQSFLNNLIKNGLGGDSGPSGRRARATATLTNPEAEVKNEGIAAARIRLARDVVPNFGTSGRYDILANLVSCNDQNKPGPNNCVITDNMRNAISQKMTVKQAVDGGLFNANGPFGFKSWDPQAIEPSITDGIPYRSILIMRKYRIVPVGWELAARYIQHFEKKPHSLSELISEKFYNDPNSPFYHFIDPDWVLTAPDAFCKLQGPGPEIISSQVGQGSDLNKDGKFDGPDEEPPSIQVRRNENYCADEQTCIKKDAKGTCQFYGYCTEEKRVWNFGANSCEPVFNTCATLANKESGATVSYLLNTVNFDSCDEKSVGCKQYSRWKNIPPPTPETEWKQGPYPDTIHLNAKAAACDQDNAGCGAFIRSGVFMPKDTLPGVNLLANPSFEASVSGGNVQGWTDGASPIQGTALKTNQTDASDGSNYLEFNPPNNSAFQRVVLDVDISEETFTLSFYARYVGVASNQRVHAGVTGVSPQLITLTPSDLLTDQWQRYVTTIAPGTMNTTNPEVQILGPAGTQIDAVKFEVGSQATPYSPYGAGASAAGSLHLKRAPDYLGCEAGAKASDTPDPNADKEECQSYARSCVSEEVGCLRYTPQDERAPITSVRGDVCPAECLGYDTYTQSKTFFESAKFVDLIPKGARKCAAAAVGCDEFTNLDVEKQGGEAKEYYKQVRYCQKPGNSDDGVFYTWEGSDTTGFQLKVFQLKKSDMTCDPNILGGGPTCLSGNTLPAEAWPRRGTPPCVWPKYDGDGNAICKDFTASWGDPLDRRYCLPSDLGVNPDCRQFYDPDGNISYRLYSRTVSVSNDCRPYRKTQSTKDDCETSNGYWNTDIAACIYQVVPKEGRRCSAAAAGCREYRGGTSADYRSIFNDTFETGTGSWTGGSLSPVASVVGGHSYKLTGIPPQVTKSLSVTQGNLITKAYYILSFWARRQDASAATQIQVNVEYPNSTPPPPTITKPFMAQTDLADDWKFYQSDPVELDLQTTVTFKLTVSGGSGPVYLDNIELKSNVNTHYLIKNSWSVPDSCRVPEDMLGCQAFKVSDGKTRNIWRFGEACHDKVVGCEAVINTQNTTIGADAAFEKKFNDDNVVVPADAIDFLVNDQAKQCRVEFQGCEALGVPIRDDTNNTDRITGWQRACSNDTSQSCSKDADCSAGARCQATSTYRLNNPDAYDTALCRVKQRQCSAYTTSKNSEIYFKDPGKSVCRYLTNVPQPGWYHDVCSNDSNISCSEASDCASGASCGPPRTGGPNCNSQGAPRTLVADGVSEPKALWTGLCPTDQNSCTELIDPRSDANRNLLYNGSFALRTNPLNPPDGWTPGSNPPLIAYDTTKGVRVSEYAVPPADPDGLRQIVPIELQGQTLYTLSSEVSYGGDAVPAFIGIRSCDVPGFTSDCRADWNGDNEVTVDEINAGVNAALGGCTVNPCPGDLNNNGDVTVDEIVTMVNIALGSFSTGSCNSPLRSPDGSMVNLPDTGGTFAMGTFHSLSPNVPDDKVRLSGQFYSKHSSAYTCDVVIGTAGIVPSGVTTTPLGNGTSGHWFKNVSLRRTDISYQLADRVDRQGCNGVVNNNSGCVLFNERAVDSDRASKLSGAMSYRGVGSDADMSPFAPANTPNTQIPNSLTPEFGECKGQCSSGPLTLCSADSDCVANNGPCLLNGVNKRCSNITSRSCLYDRDCDLPFDSNSLLKVTPDRECAAWLSCRTARTITTAGVTRKVCLDEQGCENIDDQGNCVSPVLTDLPNKNLTYSPGNVDLIQNRSGYSKVGFDWGGICTAGETGDSCAVDADCNTSGVPPNGRCQPRIVQGYMSPAFMPQKDSRTSVPNGTFESATKEGNPTGWFGWQNGQNFRAIDNPLSAQKVGVSYPLEGRKFLEVNANHAVPMTANFSNYIPVTANTDYVISGYLNTRNFRGKSAEVRVYEYDNTRQPLLVREPVAPAQSTQVCSGLNVMLLIDQSANVTATDQLTLKNSLIGFVNKLVLTAQNVYMGAATFADKDGGTNPAKVIYSPKLMNLSTAIELGKAIKGLPAQVSGDSFIEPGLKRARQTLDSLPSNRTALRNIILVVTASPDIKDDSAAVTEASTFKSSSRLNGQIYAVGVGPVLDSIVRTDIVTQPSSDYYFWAANFASLKAELDNVINDSSVNGLCPRISVGGDYSAVLNTGPGADWTLVTDKFRTTDKAFHISQINPSHTNKNDTSYIRLQLSWTAPGECSGDESQSCYDDAGCPNLPPPNGPKGLCVATGQSGTWYIDDIKIEPALEYQKNEVNTPALPGTGKICRGDPMKSCMDDSDCRPPDTLTDVSPCGPYLAPDFPGLSYESGLETLDYHYASQSCRLYPEADALSCKYFDDKGLRHKGKLGYCLEWDPQNSNYCLQWWPVDSVIGEETGEERAGYDDRLPLYMCANAQSTVDSAEPYDRTSGGLKVTTDGNGYNRSYGNKPLNKVSEYQKYGIPLAVCLGPARDRDEEGGNFWCRDHPFPYCSSPFCITAQDALVPGDELIYRQPADYNKAQASGSKAEPAVDDERYEIWSLQKAMVRSNPTVKVPPKQISGNWFEFWAVFDKDKAVIDHFSYVVSDDGNNTGNFDFLDGIRFYNAYCGTVAQVVSSDGQNQAWRNRVDRRSGFQVPILGYEYNEDFAPFGGVVQPEPIDNPIAWDSRSTVGGQPLYLEPPDTKNYQTPPYQARAGSPYACELSQLSTGSTWGLACRSPSGRVISAPFPVCNILHDPITGDVKGACANTPKTCQIDNDCADQPPICDEFSDAALADPNGVVPCASTGSVCAGGSNEGKPCTQDSDCPIYPIGDPNYDPNAISSCSVNYGIGFYNSACGLDQTEVVCPYDGTPCPLGAPVPVCVVSGVEVECIIKNRCAPPRCVLGGSCVGGTKANKQCTRDVECRDGVTEEIGQKSKQEGIELLKLLFTQSYGIWEWPGPYARSYDFAPDQGWLPPTEQCDKYPGECISGNVGASCRVDSDCGVVPPGSCVSPSTKDNERPFMAFCEDDHSLACVVDSDCGVGMGKTCQINPAAYCAVAPQVPEIYINNQKSAGVTITRNGTVTLSFTAIADPDQEPIAQYIIDWGDGSPLTKQTGLQLQSRPTQQNAITLVHNYSYADIVRCWNDTGGCRSQTPGLDCAAGTSCTITPRVQITDNWGWCNGNYEAPPDRDNPLKGQDGYSGSDCSPSSWSSNCTNESCRSSFVTITVTE